MSNERSAAGAQAITNADERSEAQSVTSQSNSSDGDSMDDLDQQGGEDHDSKASAAWQSDAEMAQSDANDCNDNQVEGKSNVQERPHHEHTAAREAFAFDDAYLEQAQGEVEGYDQQVETEMAGLHMPWFTFSELCEAQSKLNTKASVSQLAPIPVALIVQADEVWRTCLLILLNLSLLTGSLAPSWNVTPQAPIPKPNKSSWKLGGNRPISLLHAIFKLLDKLLHGRIGPAVHKAVQPWQFGGSADADEVAWLLVQSLN